MNHLDIRLKVRQWELLPTPSACASALRTVYVGFLLIAIFYVGFLLINIFAVIVFCFLRQEFSVEPWLS